MNGKAPSASSTWYTEPLKRISTYVATAAAVITAVLAVLNQTGVLDLVPAEYRSGVTATIAGLGTALVILHKVQGYLGRNGVPGTNFNGMLSPKTAHEAMVASALPTPAAMVPADPAANLAHLGEALGTNVDGTPVV